MKYFKDIRFWIFLFFVVRLFGITDAPLEMGHNWRQSLTNMIARNFLEISPNIFYPRIDMAGELTGILGSEFPLFSYLIFLIAKVFGYDHWYGRLINLITSSAGSYYFFLIIRKFFNRQIAFNATIILILSIWFSFSRKIMPDIFSVSLVIIGLYYCLSYFEKGKILDLILFFLLVTTGILVKIPALSLMSILAIPILSKYRLNRKLAITGVSIVIVGIVSVWYFYWVPYLLENYHFKLYFPKGLLEGFSEIIQYPFETLDKFWFTSFYSFIAFAVFIVGLVLMVVKRNQKLIWLFSLTSVVFFLFILKTGDVFSFHNYYIIPYTPVMALMAGYGLSFLKPGWQYILLVLIGVESLFNQSYDFIIKENEMYKLELESSVKDIIPKENLIIVNGSPSPQTIYFLHRRGWTADNEKLLEPLYISEKITKGARYLVIDKNRLDHEFAFPIVYQSNDITVYRLNKHQ